ncbi:hypothetical protein BWI97_26340, partial [Siphonobacter sp. BAB-5405]|uniref:hypothetical protein n=1 Tax=Siphonobacter sp. BAB-5405 TaxID=1864825 RepID=UPI000CA9315E
MKRSQLPLIFVLVWFISTLYLLTGAIVFNRVSLQSILLIVSSQLLQMGVILASALYIFPRYLKGQTLGKLFGSIGAVLTGFVLTRYGLEEILLVDWLGLSTRERIDLPFSSMKHVLLVPGRVYWLYHLSVNQIVRDPDSQSAVS